MADALIADRVREAYLRPIRSVLVVDDDFHLYDADKPGKDAERARALWRACRTSGYLCEIDDGADLINGHEPAHLSKSDLVILDYHLQGDDPKWALQLLCKLAPADHASIVVVYTQDPNLANVRMMIAAHLRGGLPTDQFCESPAIQDQWDRVESKITQRPTEALFLQYLSGDPRACRIDKPLLAEIENLDVSQPLNRLSAHLDFIFREFLGRFQAGRFSAAWREWPLGAPFVLHSRSDGGRDSPGAQYLMSLRRPGRCQR